MILSFHPIITADRNMLCAGRPPAEHDREAIRAARAVILPQGCSEELYRIARADCPHVFPNLDARFAYAGKLEQLRLFQRLGVAHPASRLFPSVAAFHAQKPTITFPVVLKWDWGGEGDTVFKVDNTAALTAVLQRTRACESSGQYGFIVQEYIPSDGRALRLTQIGTTRMAYWRVQPQRGSFGSALSRGARIDDHVAAEPAAAAGRVVARLATHTGLQLAGFDFIFDRRRLARGEIEPLLLEINFFFGRRGLGGSAGYYAILTREVDAWLAAHGLARPADSDGPMAAGNDETA